MTDPISDHEPFDRIVDLAQQHQVKISTPMMGEAVDIAEAQSGQRWWLEQLPARRMVKKAKQGVCPFYALVGE